MKKLMSSALLLGTIFTLAGCSNNEELVEKQQVEIASLQAEVTALEQAMDDQEEIIKSQQEQLNSRGDDFTFVNDFTVEDHNAYRRFLETKKTVHLTNFTPEKNSFVIFAFGSYR